MRNLKTYIEYRIKTGLNPKLIIKDTTFWMFLIAIGMLYIILKSSLSPLKKAIIYSISIIIIEILRELSIAKTGAHIEWKRKQLGIPSRAERKRMKKLFSPKLNGGKMEETIQEEKNPESENTEGED